MAPGAAGGATSSHRLEFWFDFASTYSYVAAARIEAEAGAAQVAIVWRPFLLGPLFAKQGWNDSPFNLNPARGRYMWRDLQRLTARHGLPWRRPSRFPRSSVLAARVALTGLDQDWLPGVVRALFHANFAADLDIADRRVVADLLRDLGLPADDLLGRAVHQDTKDQLRRLTDEAWERGLFGAPSFVAGQEVFWGQDRLGEALDWARQPGRDDAV